MSKCLSIALVILLGTNIHALNVGNAPKKNYNNQGLARRSFISVITCTTTISCLGGTGISLGIAPLPVHASSYPSVTVAQFQQILQDSGTFFFQNINVLAHTIRHNITHISLFLSFVYIPHSLLYTCIASSIKIVELSGPKSETALVTLVDGTLFQISDLFESPTDPRSPLKLVATCRSYGVKTQFSSLKNAIAELSEKGGGKRRKVYMNKRVQEAMEKEKEKKERMAQDEAERIMLEEQQK